MNNFSYYIKAFWRSCPTAFPQTHATETAPKKASKADAPGQKQTRSNICVVVQETLS